VRELIERQSRRRQAATGGESSIPLDAETERALAAQGLTMIRCPMAESRGHGAQDRQSAYGRHHPRRHRHRASGLIDAAIKSARAIDIPVTGIDFLVELPSRRLRVHRGQ
jgi:hypothetical protein